MADKVTKIEIFTQATEHSCTTLWVKILLQISVSYGFRDIHTFLLSPKIQNGCQRWRKLKFVSLEKYTLVLPVGQKFARNHSISYFFHDIFNV